jgi:hypothetical protein
MPITTTPSGGPQGEFSTYTPIYSQTLTSTATSITFSNIPTTYTDLVLAISVIPSGAGLSPQIRVNGDSGSNYSYTTLYGNGTSALSARGSGNNTTYLYYANSPTSGTTAQYDVQFQNYSNATTFKTMLHKLSVAGIESTLQCVLWRSTSPITSMQIFTSASSFASGSTFTIYGIKAAAPAPKATGGDVITTDGTYWYHAFKNSGIFTPASALSCDYLVVAGGGGGGSAGSTNAGYGGGGGAGGYRSATAQSFTATNYNIIVGAGGAQNTNGADSLISGSGFTTFTSTGGGFGGNKFYVGRSAKWDGANGGSGGGAGNNISNLGGLGNTPSTSPSQGNNGGAGYTGGGNAAGSGGGGATGVGAIGTNNGAGGAGGAGSNSLSTWATATGTGVSGYFAGGGGGGVENDTYAGGAGGSGGGGKGDGSNGDAVAGTVNTGGGGGGGGDSTAKSGGSGIVIVRYAV